ncbi:MAG TPA: Rrf2 family transcriptional regulator [Candidatus Bathyarchaeia archaeon]|nr:Rrf2 family transcriptional regulator [Candidatus Bathyarchaeia archaeon]
MFGLTKKADYGIELMITLAKNYGQGPLSLRQVAKRKKLPFKFLEQLAILLREAGLIDAKEGRGGGYLLKKAPEKISIGQIVKVLEGPVEVGACFGCPKATICGQKDVWSEVGEKVKKTMEKKSLADLV